MNNLIWLNQNLTDIQKLSSNAQIIGYDIDGTTPIYRKRYKLTNPSTNTNIDSNLTTSTVEWFRVSGCGLSTNGTMYPVTYGLTDGGTVYQFDVRCTSTGMLTSIRGMNFSNAYLVIEYVLKSSN